MRRPALPAFVLVLSALLVALLPRGGLAQPAAKLDVRDLVVMINGTTPAGTSVIGAGVIVGRDDQGQTYVITAQHVAAGQLTGPPALTVALRAAPEERHPARLVDAAINPELDLAVLTIEAVDPGLPDALPIGRMAEPMEAAEELMFVGQTAGQPWAETPLTEKVGLLNRATVTVQSNYGGPGVSGGAAIDSSMRIFGIALNDRLGVIEVLLLSVIADELRKAGIPFDITEGERTAPTLDIALALSIVDRAREMRDGSSLGQGAALSLLVRQGNSFNGVDFAGINFDKANLTGADLSTTRLWLSNLDGIVADGANIRESGWRFATARQASFKGTDLAGVYAPFLIAPEADFSGATAQGASFYAGELAGARFDDADLTGAVLAFADLRGASFRNANLTKAHLIGAQLEGADFEGATFDDTNMLGAWLNPFNLTEQQRAGTCAVPISLGGGNQFVLVERWESNKYSTGYEFDDLTWGLYIPAETLVSTLLPRCPEVPHGQGFDGRYATDFRLSLDRSLLNLAGRRSAVEQRAEAFIARLSNPPPDRIIYSAPPARSDAAQ